MTKPIDLDQNATTPLDPEVLDAMRPYWLAGGNAESRHGGGRAARRGWDWACKTAAGILGAEPGEVVFTSGGTESNNLGLLGRAGSGIAVGHILQSAIEHPAAAAPIDWLEQQGWSATRVKPEPNGITPVRGFLEAIRPDTRFASLMLANNETGALQPVAELARALAEHGVPLHTDAVQAVGRIPVNFHDLGVATLAASAHKLHGPSGAGLLLVRKGTRLSALHHGGGQQDGRRPGTPAVALAVGMARALERFHQNAAERSARQRALRDRLEAGLRRALAPRELVRHGPDREVERLPQTLDVGFPNLDANALLMQLDLAGVHASLGAACASGSPRASSVLLAMGVPEPLARASIRFSLGAFTTEADIDEALDRISRLVRATSEADAADC